MSIHLKMKEIFRLLSYLALVIHCQGKSDHERDKRAEEPDYPIEEYLENCGMTQKITPEKSFKFGTPYFGSHQYPASLECSWSFVGDDACKVSITCPTLDLRKEADCEEEHLEIVDGLGGRQKFCSGQKVDQIEARNNGHDLFVRLKTMERSTFDRYYKGIFCEVSCNKGGKTKLALDPHYFSENHRCECGTFGANNSNDRIVGGQDAVFNEFPWQAAIVLPGTRKPKCGASVINTRWLLSAAHCFAFESARPEDYEILIHARVLDVVNTGPGKLIDTQRNENLGSVTDQDEGTRRYKIKEIITHPLFTSKYDYDVALIKIATSIDLSSSSAINPICLPELSFPPRDFTGDIVTVSGWGKSDQDAATTMRALQKLEVPVISRPICQELLHNRLTDRMFCAGIVDGGKDACQGDSGGPLIWKNVSSGRFIQIGIVSWGDGCAQYKRPGIYTEVTDVNQWIHTFAASGVWCSG